METFGLHHLVEEAWVQGLAAAGLLLAPRTVAVQHAGAADFVAVLSVLLHVVRKKPMKDPQDGLTGGQGVLRDCGQGQSQPQPLLVHPETALKQGNMKIMDQVAAKQQLFFPGLIKKTKSVQIDSRHS